MLNPFPRLLLAAASLCWVAANLHAAPVADRTALGDRTALDRYVKAPDTNYSFHLATTIKGDGYTTYMIDMISQAWLTTNEVDRPLWQHWLTLVKPDRITSDVGLLFIGGGSHKTNPPSKAEANIIQVA